MEKRFYFMLTEKVEGVTFKDLGDIFEAVENEDGYLVYWSEYGEIYNVFYSKELAQLSLNEGYWIAINDEEVEKIIKGN